MPTQIELHETFRTEHLQADLKGRAVRGGLLTFTAQGTGFVLASIMTVVLARLLTPADFGLVAMVTAITGLGQAFADLGLSEATIQRKEITHDQVSALFWINVAIGLGLMLATIGLAPVLVWFYREPRLKTLTWVMSLTFLIGGFRVHIMRFCSARCGSWGLRSGMWLALSQVWRPPSFWRGVAPGTGPSRRILSRLTPRK